MAMSPQGCGGVAPTAAVVAAAVWDALLASHTDAGSFGKQLGTVEDVIWNEVMSGHATADSFGKRLDDAVGLDTLSAAKVAFLDEAISAAKQGLITKTTGTFSLPDGTTKQTLLELATNDELVTISLDLSNLAQLATIGVEEKIDGTNYRVVDTIEYSTDVDGTSVIVTLDGKGRDQKITVQSTITEGAARDIPHARVEVLRAV